MAADHRERQLGGQIEQFDERFADHALDPVPASERRSFVHTVSVFVAWVITTTPFLVAGALAAGLTFWQSILALLVGTVITATVGTLVGLVGFRTGMTSYLISRVVYGAKGSTLISVLIGILSVGFIGVISSFLGAVISAGVPFLPPWLAALLFVAVATVISLVGYSGLSVVGRVSVPLLWILGLFFLWRLSVAGGGFGHITSVVPKGSLPFGVAVTIIVADWITGATIASDIARYARRGTDVAVASYLGWVVSYSLFALVGLVAYYGTGTSDIVALLTKLGLVSVTILVFFTALISSTDVNLYSFSLALTNLSDAFGLRQLGRPVWVIIGGIITALISLLGYANTFLPLLLTIGTIIPAYAGVVLAHYYLRAAMRRRPEELVAEIDPGVRWTAMVAFLIGVAVAFFIKAGIPALQGLVAAGIAYALLEWASTARRPRSVAVRG